MIVTVTRSIRIDLSTDLETIDLGFLMLFEKSIKPMKSSTSYCAGPSCGYLILEVEFVKDITLNGDRSV